ncbi:flagellar basal body-associated protein FliL [Bacillus niameyensis]|uniref:flagellar basal body-associated protein FliL n=1 Tax=Bacillus niameyensis TaxID=1522308 RepID=UPI000785C418|nr:flagellar basal body-associated protein FliL [Bacillus niameyensis]
MGKLNKKLVSTMIVLLSAILLLAAFALIIILKMDAKDENKEPSIEEVLKVSVDVPEITTNLKNGQFIKISFKVQTNSKKAKKELEKRDFQVKNIIISELSEMDRSSLDNKEDKLKFEEKLKEQFGELMQNGKIIKVYITSSMIS